MVARYSDSELGIDADRWYYTKFNVERYKQETSWDDIEETFDRTADAVKSLLRAFRSAGVFGDAELRALKSTIQVPHTVGPGRTIDHIQETEVEQAELEKATELVEEGTGIVGGTALPVSTGDTSPDGLFDIFDTLLDNDADLEKVDAAAEQLLSLDLENVSGATISPLLCLLRPNRYPTINTQSRQVFDHCFDIELSADAEDYLECAAQFRTVQEEFGFEPNFRHLDYFCYWLREDVGQEDTPLPEGFESRKVWQINAGQSVKGEPEVIWPVWRELGICSIGWDVGSLDDLSVSEIETTAADRWDGDEGDYLRRFGKEIEPGQLIVAKDGDELLGIGVTQRGGYHYAPDAINQRLDDDGIDHVHAWPVEWHVIPSPEDREVSDWGLETGLSARKTLVGSEAFEGIRWGLADRDASLIPTLASLEELVRNPTTASLPDGFRSDTPAISDYFILQTGNPKWDDDPPNQYYFELGNAGTRQLWNAERAEIVYLENGELYAKARITDVERTESDNPDHCVATIEGYEEIDSVEFDDILGELETGIARQNSIIKITEDDYEVILEESSEGIQESDSVEQRVDSLQERLTPPTIDIDLPDELYFESDDDLRRQIKASLNSGQHIIFTGPPGTGKTKLAKHLCNRVSTQHGDLVDGSRFTTATAEWTTFDTVGGYVPNRAAEGDELVFQPRMFLDCLRDGESVKNEWLVIDEINRSDIDKAFGQLFSVLSGDSVELPYERDSTIEIAALNESTDRDRLEEVVTNEDIFPVTPSWRLLGTMNTYDKTSLYELSYAFMRRFNFIHVGVPPLTEDGEVRTSLLDPGGEENYATEWIEADDSLREPLENTFEQLAVVWQKVNNHQTIGPSIVKDMLEYLAATDLSNQADPGPALTDAVIALVFPQLEGMRPQEQRNLVDSLTDDDVSTETGSVNLTLDGDRLERKAVDFFDLPARSDD